MTLRINPSPKTEEEVRRNFQKIAELLNKAVDVNGTFTVDGTTYTVENGIIVEVSY
jgi:hypothetical protein